MRRSAAVLLLAVLAGVGSAGCRRPHDRRPALCTFDVASDTELEHEALPAETLLTLVSPAIDRQVLARTGPWRDACGVVLEPPAEEQSCPAPSGADPIAGDRIEASDVVVAQVGDGHTIAWAATEELTDGRARGTVALLQWRERGVAILATGVITAHRTGARARLHHTSGIEVLVLEGDRCAASGECTRITRFVPRLGDRFTEIDLHEPGRGCIGPSELELERRAEMRMSDGWVRTFRLSRTVELDDTGIVLTDLVIVEDHDARDPAAPIRPFRRATARRPLALVDGHFELEEEDLWARVLRDDGGTKPMGRRLGEKE